MGVNGRWYRVVSSVAIALSLAAGRGQAQSFVATLTGGQEVPPNASGGIGSATVTVDGHWLSVHITFSDLLGTTTASHIHCCAPADSTAGVVTAVPTFPGFPLGVTSGTYSHLFDLMLASTYNPSFLNNAENLGNTVSAMNALLAGLNAGRAYVNVHTTQLPGGEIRGNLVASTVPEPVSMALLGTGIAAIGVARRRRRSAERRR